MIRLLIKKVFFDIWDNLMFLMILNIGFDLSLALFFLAGSFVETHEVLTFVLVVLAVLVFSLYSLGVNAVVHGYSRYQKNGMKGFFDAYKYHIGHALLHFGLCIAFAMTLLYVIPFYLAMRSIIGYLLGMMTFWILVAFVLAIQYFFPLCFHMEADGPFKTLKKCFIVMADNMGTTLFLALRTVIDLALTIVTASLLPGLGGIALSRMDTIRLLMKKYDFLEENPGCTKKDINWEDLLYEENKLVGPRSLKGMLFPWKD